MNFAERGAFARKIEPRIGVHRRIEDSCASANHHFVVAEAWAPRKAKAGRDVGFVRKDQIVA